MATSKTKQSVAGLVLATGGAIAGAGFTGLRRPAPEPTLHDWAEQYVVGIHPVIGIDELDYAPGQARGDICLMIVSGSAGGVGERLGLGAGYIKGVRTLESPFTWPLFPPPGSAVEKVWDLWADVDNQDRRYTREQLEDVCARLLIELQEKGIQP